MERSGRLGACDLPSCPLVTVGAGAISPCAAHASDSLAPVETVTLRSHSRGHAHSEGPGGSTCLRQLTIRVIRFSGLHFSLFAHHIVGLAIWASARPSPHSDARRVRLNQVGCVQTESKVLHADERRGQWWQRWGGRCGWRRRSWSRRRGRCRGGWWWARR